MYRKNVERLQSTLEKLFEHVYTLNFILRDKSWSSKMMLNDFFFKSSNISNKYFQNLKLRRIIND